MQCELCIRYGIKTPATTEREMEVADRKDTDIFPVCDQCADQLDNGKPACFGLDMAPYAYDCDTCPYAGPCLDLVTAQENCHDCQYNGFCVRTELEEPYEPCAAHNADHVFLEISTIRKP